MTDSLIYKIAFERLKEVGKVRNQQHLADLLGFNKATLSQILNGLLPPSKQFVYEFKKRFPEFNEIWLETGAGEMLVNSNILQEEYVKYKGVPYYEDLDVTASIITSFHDYKEVPTFFIDYKHFNDCDIYLPVVGDSMQPKYYAGEIVAIKQIKNFETILWGETHLVITNDNANSLRTIKDVHFCKDESKLILRACNPDYAGDTYVNKADVISLFIVKGAIKRNQL